MKWVGPVKIDGDFSAELNVPMATFETTLWPSTARGAKLSRLTDGIQVTLIDNKMTRSITLEADNASAALTFCRQLEQKQESLQQEISKVSRYTKLIDLQFKIIGSLIYLRFEFTSGEAGGHNMVTKASEIISQFILSKHPELRYVSLSGNYCTDKKVSAVNSILGRGKNVVAEIAISQELCQKHLRCSPAALVALNTKKNLIGSIAAGSLNSANAHYANILLAVYLATGQDAANIVEGSQGISYAEVRDGDLYFSVTMPNIIVGVVGNGKNLEFVQENLVGMGNPTAEQLACIVAATTLCSELSLLAALTNQNELMRAHTAFERNIKKSGDNQ